MIFPDWPPIVFPVGIFINEIILVIRVATESSPFGKITREAGVFICFHFMEGGSPPKTCEKAGEQFEMNKIATMNFKIQAMLLFINKDRQMLLGIEIGYWPGAFLAAGS